MDNSIIIAAHVAALQAHLGLRASDINGTHGNNSVASNASSDFLAKERVIFFVELSPQNARGCKCRLETCSEGHIAMGEHRIAMMPAMTNGSGPRSERADYYHMRCFEIIADLSKDEYLEHILPLTTQTYPYRKLSMSTMKSHAYKLSGGITRLIDEWWFQRCRWIDEAAGIPIQPVKGAIADLYHSAGLPTYRGTYRDIPGMSEDVMHIRAVVLAPNESDGPEDDDPWNLFDAFLVKTRESLHDRHDLSKLIQKWETHRKLATQYPENLTCSQKEARGKLSKKAIRAIQRLSAFP